jgi:hypothetical protein
MKQKKIFQRFSQAFPRQRSMPEAFAVGVTVKKVAFRAARRRRAASKTKGPLAKALEHLSKLSSESKVGRLHDYVVHERFDDERLNVPETYLGHDVLEVQRQAVGSNDAVMEGKGHRE